MNEVELVENDEEFREPLQAHVAEFLVLNAKVYVRWQCDWFPCVFVLIKARFAPPNGMVAATL